MPATAPITAASSNETAIAPFGSNVYNKKNRSASANNSTDVILTEKLRKRKRERKRRKGRKRRKEVWKKDKNK